MTARNALIASCWLAYLANGLVLPMWTSPQMLTQFLGSRLCISLNTYLLLTTQVHLTLTSSETIFPHSTPEMRLKLAMHVPRLSMHFDRLYI